MKLNVYGRLVQVLQREGGWQVFYLGNEGKKRAATDILIPPQLSEKEIPSYIADLCHEWAHPGNTEVKPV
ncbi:MAG: hypothetical protein OEX00_02725 [Gammaproteobacteria bacterium]|nr:hypothetical protein [Gammaproteobacteria bacterium]MDH5694296.1 hypothetical protein [Gammaproteobacteria bacterium]